MRTISEFKQDKETNLEQTNTNNGWGFGGSRRKVYSYKGLLSYTKGFYDYRHIPSRSFTHYVHNFVEVSKKEFLEIYTKLSKNS